MFVPICVLLSTLTVLTSASLNSTAASCTITKYSAAAILDAQNQCSEITLRGINVDPGETLDLTHLQKGAKVIFDGTITWQYEEWRGPLLRTSGTDVEITGTADHVLDGRGSKWWDGKGGNGGKNKPRFYYPNNMKNSKITNLNIKNTPVHAIVIKNCDGLVLENIRIDDSDGDTQGGHNTDGFDISGSNNVEIRSSTVYNQDDCLAVKSGTNYKFTNNFCSGGHGISIGSVADGVTVENVYMADSQVERSANGIRIKTVSGAVGKVSGITFENISLKDITNYGIILESDYLNGGPSGQPTGDCPITDLTIKNITGTVASGGSNVYVIVENASDWKCSGIDIKGGTKTKDCQGIPPGSDTIHLRLV
ncbi:hypothetical protein NQ315_006826 [Exocentrus adspersus]|uniref:endo-polygalacturonase n=1 Tax=Exocentrus adspersus TaxID=1586481 RepID=A0AAV8WBX4_9CUCU|nr:hypothetical protein NQ315_006826 [Exocentrus adspersus]